jgi:hypothetical protein
MNTLLTLLTIFVAGSLGGLTNAIRTDKAKNDYWKSIVKGIVAAFLIPLFLEIIRSNIGKELNTNLYDYLVFGGLCLTAAIFSDKFIDTLGDKILQKADRAEQKASESSEKINTMIEKVAEPENDLQSQVESRLSGLSASTGQENDELHQVINALKNTNYHFRTISGIAKETKLDENTVKKSLLHLQEKDLVKQVDTGRRTVWTLSE